MNERKRNTEKYVVTRRRVRKWEEGREMSRE